MSKARKKKKNFRSPQKMKPGMMLISLIIFILGLIGTGVYSSSEALPIEGTPPKLYASQCRDDLCSTFKQAINEAKQSILIVIYGLTDKEIIQTLREKADQGVDITVIYDDSASPGLKKKLGNRIKAVNREGISGLMHRKIVVVDHSQVWLGSANLTSASLRMHDNLIMGMHAPVLADLMTSKANAAIGQSQAIDHPKDYLINGQHIELWFLPEDKEALGRLLQLIRSAKKTLRIAMYTWTHPQITEEVIQAHRRGVRVEAALDRQMSNGASAQVVKLLQQNRIPIGFNSGAQLLHHKFAQIDENTLVMGSANWTKAAFTRNEDIFIVLHQLTDEQKKLMNSLWNILRSECQIPSEPEEPLLQACGE